MVGVYQQDDIGLADLLPQGISFLRERGCIHNRRGNVLRGTNAGRDCDLWEYRLNFVRHKDIFN